MRAGWGGRGVTWRQQKGVATRLSPKAGCGRRESVLVSRLLLITDSERRGDFLFIILPGFTNYSVDFKALGKEKGGLEW